MLSDVKRFSLHVEPNFYIVLIPSCLLFCNCYLCYVALFIPDCKE